MSLYYGHYYMMNDKYVNNKYTVMFIDMGASHTSVSIVDYLDHDIIVRARGTSSEINSDLIEGFVEDAIRKCAEEDIEEIESYEEKLEDVVSNLNFVNNRKKIKELKELCASGKQKVVSVNWDGGEEYENTCMLGESLLCRRHQHF